MLCHHIVLVFVEEVVGGVADCVYVCVCLCVYVFRCVCKLIT